VQSSGRSDYDFRHRSLHAGKRALRSTGNSDVQFHAPIEPADFGDRDCLMAQVRAAINSGLPVDLQETAPKS